MYSIYLCNLFKSKVNLTTDWTEIGGGPNIELYKDFEDYGWDAGSYCHRIYSGREKTNEHSVQTYHACVHVLVCLIRWIIIFPSLPLNTSVLIRLFS